MEYGRRYDLRWLGALFMVALLSLLAACSKSSGGDEPEPTNKPVLKIYVFPPDRPVVTRPDNGDVNPISEEENTIHNLHVWVFETGTSNLVGHISLNNVDISQSGSTVSLELSDAFVNLAVKPNVDVFVAANVTNVNCGLSLSATTPRSQLEGAMIGQYYFGLSPLVDKIPADGLPMSGVMKDKKITGSDPVYQVSEKEEDGGSLANVRLVRAVSKVRFVFSKSDTNPDEVKIKNLKFDAGVLPIQEYLFLEDAYDLSTTQKYHIDGGDDSKYVPVEPVSPLISSESGFDVNKSPSPASYSYDGKMTGQEYESLIQQGVEDENLSDLGTFYLRESDRILKGTIDYTINGSPKTASFTMKAPGDFSRNHTWIVYSYFVSSGDLIIGTVLVKDPTNTVDITYEVYNW